MSQLFYLSVEKLERIKPFFLKVISGIIHVIKHGLQWKDAPREYGPHKTLHDRFVRWSHLDVFDNIFAELANLGHGTHGRPGERLQRSRLAYGCLA